MTISHHAELTDDVRDELVLHAFGLLEGEDARAMERHLKAGCPACNLQYDELGATIGTLPNALELVQPPPQLKQRLMARIRGESRVAEEPEPGIFVVRNTEREWKRTPFPGVLYIRLYTDRDSGYSTTLLKLEPGSKYPAHHHAGVEQSWVIEGSCRIGSVTIGKGDFAYASSGTDHGIIESDHGCVLLVTASEHDEVFV